MKIIFLEAGIVSLLAGILGYFIGLGAAKVALVFFSESQTGQVVFNPELAVGALGISLLLGLVSSAYPAIMASRLDPNEALRAL